jgi:spermidine/putrescine transport system ATP-binding protein
MRGAVRLEGVTRSFGDLVAVRDVTLDVRPGEFLTLLGPSGCGKTTLLRLVAGFDAPDAGRVVLSGQDVTALPPYRRPVNTVFQHYALFPHLTVAGNVAFGLEMSRRPAGEVRARVARALEMVRLDDLGIRTIDKLSGGQKQRVAVARALVLEPDVLLLDEPLGALDLKLRQEMQVEVKALHERLGTTFLFVTHDQEEALVMSDRIGVMNAGRIEQVATPQELYERPRTRFVADFLGVRNLLEATVESAAGGRASLRTAAGTPLTAGGDGFPAGARVFVGIRAERIRLAAGGENTLAGTVEEEVYLGDRTEWRVRVGGDVLTVSEGAASARRRARGEAVEVSFPADAVLPLGEAVPPEGGGR